MHARLPQGERRRPRSLAHLLNFLFQANHVVVVFVETETRVEIGPILGGVAVFRLAGFQRGNGVLGGLFDVERLPTLSEARRIFNGAGGSERAKVV